MTEEKEKPKIEEKKEESKKKSVETKKELKEEKKTEKKKEEKKEEKVEEKKEEKPEKKEEKKEAPKVSKKEEAVAKSVNLHVSKRHCMYVCRFIKNKKIDDAIKDLELVIKFKKAVPFKGEVPHRKGKGMMSGRYPIKASKLFINMLKSLKGNVIVNGLDLDNTRIYFASASWASRPMRSGGRQAKRSNVILKAKEMGGKK